MWNRAALLAMAAYILLSAVLHHHYQYRLNPDGVSYLRAAERYAQGDFQGAVNGYWAPLLSWLTALGIRAGITPLTAIKVWEFFFGLVLLAGMSGLLARFEVVGKPRALALGLGVVHALCFSLTLVTPDVVTAAILILYYVVIWDPEFARKPWSGMLCGALGALAYFAKNYNFYFFAIHYAAMCAWYFRSATAPKDRAGVVAMPLPGSRYFSRCPGYG